MSHCPRTAPVHPLLHWHCHPLHTTCHPRVYKITSSLSMRSQRGQWRRPSVTTYDAVPSELCRRSIVTVLKPMVDQLAAESAGKTFPLATGCSIEHQGYCGSGVSGVVASLWTVRQHGQRRHYGSRRWCTISTKTNGCSDLLVVDKLLPYDLALAFNMERLQSSDI